MLSTQTLNHIGTDRIAGLGFLSLGELQLFEEDVAKLFCGVNVKAMTDGVINLFFQRGNLLAQLDRKSVV